MGLSQNDIEKIRTELKEGNISQQDLLKQYTVLITQSIETNTKIFNEIKKATQSIEKISAEVSNGMSSVVSDSAEKIETIYTDVSSKEGYLPQISNKLTYL